VQVLHLSVNCEVTKHLVELVRRLDQ
jgi:hypothetical protein